MLTRIHGNLVLECDACGDTLETETKDFNEALRALSGNNWRARKVGADWVHSCEGCAEGDAGTRERRARRGGRIP